MPTDHVQGLHGRVFIIHVLFQMIIERIVWPEPDSDEEEEIDDYCSVVAHLRQYISLGEKCIAAALSLTIIHSLSLIHTHTHTRAHTQATLCFFVVCSLASSSELQQLIEFWTGWAVLPDELYVSVDRDAI